MTKNTLKYLGAAGLIILIGFTALYFIRYLQYKNSPERQMEESVKAWEKAYREDTYGGITPEETLQLFIDALKKGDTDLAAKYFIIDEQEKINKELLEAKNANNLENIVKRIQSLELSKRDGDSVFFTASNNENVLEYQALLRKNVNGKWKIIDL